MRVLLDTHAFLWWIADDPRLSSKARSIISNGNNTLFLSAASGWEMTIKTRLGKLELPDDFKEFIAEQLVINGIDSLPVQMRHALHIHTLPPLHQDPFDRMLIAQAQLEDLPILTADPQIAQYRVEVLW
ncbi:type II toxin-antitoxin system VapC family toxin [Desulforudis sp. 1088]|uniref:type II toxin-antitoxin system VapC family toxin n=1 Tax=unclassified Candidatus Desulforudis TaxID=2635950 RepID=UPI003CE52780